MRYDWYQSSEDVEQKMEKFHPANLQKLLKTKKFCFQVYGEEYMQLLTSHAKVFYFRYNYSNG